MTTYKAVKVSGARSSDLVAVFGVGGLGHLAVQYARIAGAAVVAVDLFDDKLELARKLGAAYTVNARSQNPVDEIKKLGGADAAIATMARSAEDLRLALGFLAGPDGHDSHVPPVPWRGDLESSEMHDLRIAWSPEFPGGANEAYSP